MAPGYGPTPARDGSRYIPIHGRILAYQNSFIQSVVGDWNALPKEIRTIDSRNSFKDSVSKHYRKP